MLLLASLLVAEPALRPAAATLLPPRRLRAGDSSPFGGGYSPFGGDDTFDTEEGQGGPGGPGGGLSGAGGTKSPARDHALPGQPMHRVALPRSAPRLGGAANSHAGVVKEGELTAAAADLTKATGDLTQWDAGMFQKGKSPKDKSKWVGKHKEILHELLAAANFLHNWEHFEAAHHMPANETMSSKMVDETLGISVDHSGRKGGSDGSRGGGRVRRGRGASRSHGGAGGGADAGISPAAGAISAVVLVLAVVLFMSARGASGRRVEAGDYSVVEGAEFRVLGRSAGSGMITGSAGGAGGYQYGLDDAGVVDDFDLDDEGGFAADEGGSREKETESMVADSSFS